MPLLNYLKIYGDDITPLLGQGERLISVTPFQLAYGSKRLERTQEDIDRQLSILPAPLRERIHALERGELSRDPKTIGDRVLSVITGSPDWPWNEVDWDAKIGGVTAVGHVGSLAYRIVEACERNPAGLFVTVTGQRLLFLRLESGTCELLFDVPRQAVIGARRRGKLLQRGRVVLAFADLSQIALMSGFLSTARARRLIASLAEW